MSSEDMEEGSLNQGHATVPISTLNALNRDLLFVQDNQAYRKIVSQPETNQLAIRQTHLNRLTFLTRKEVAIDNLQSDVDYAIIETFTEEEDFDAGLWINFKSIKRNEKMGVHDSIDGQKIKALIEKRKEIKYTEGDGARKKILGVL